MLDRDKSGPTPPLLDECSCKDFLLFWELQVVVKNRSPNPKQHSSLCETQAWAYATINKMICPLHSWTLLVQAEKADPFLPPSQWKINYLAIHNMPCGTCFCMDVACKDQNPPRIYPPLEPNGHALIQKSIHEGKEHPHMGSFHAATMSCTSKNWSQKSSQFVPRWCPLVQFWCTPSNSVIPFDTILFLFLTKFCFTWHWPTCVQNVLQGSHGLCSR